VSRSAPGSVYARATRTRHTDNEFGLRLAGCCLAPLQSAARSAIKQFPLLRQVAVRNTGPLYSSPCFSAAAIRASLESSLAFPADGLC